MQVKELIKDQLTQVEEILFPEVYHINARMLQNLVHTVNSHRTNFLHSLNSGCANIRLSHLAVPPQMMRQALDNITREITENGYTLSIPLDDLRHLPISSHLVWEPLLSDLAVASLESNR
jgi:hypothetical protein